MKQTLFTVLAACLCIFSAAAASTKTYNLTSPNKNISVDINVGENVTYSVSLNGHIALDNCVIAMETSNGTLGASPVVKSAKKGQHVGTYSPYNPYRNSTIEGNYNTLAITFKGNWSLEFRAYNNGAAYRFATAAKGKQIISNETIEYRLPQEAELLQSDLSNQMALYIVLDTGTHMLADSPYRYRLEPACTEFIAKAPTLFNETKIISAKLGKHVLLAKRSGDAWYIGGIAHKEHKQELKLDFLGEGQYKLYAIQDGRNADQLAMDHKIVEEIVTKDSVLNIKMVGEGGYVCRIEPIK